MAVLGIQPSAADTLIVKIDQELFFLAEKTA
jgi:hypothetical protein